ncbi:hypothetical protein KI372_01615 [Halobacterium salinarum]|nr:hypothetical protein [Halobacterium salinarum]MCF2240151.1 hypothetical protein [Halobacterium salinarum]
MDFPTVLVFTVEHQGIELPFYFQRTIEVNIISRQAIPFICCRPISIASDTALNDVGDPLSINVIEFFNPSPRVRLHGKTQLTEVEDVPGPIAVEYLGNPTLHLKFSVS